VLEDLTPVLSSWCSVFEVLPDFLLRPAEDLAADPLPSGPKPSETIRRTGSSP